MKSNVILWSRLFKMKSNVFFILNNLRMSKKSSTFAHEIKQQIQPMKKMMTDYEKSNKIEKVEYNKLSSKEYIKLLADNNRQVCGQNLLNYLCDKYKINRIPLIVLEKPRKSNKRGQTLGFYKYGPNRGISITIYNLTAKTNTRVAIKRFADTLLHEFIHHYDNEYLKIKSAHTCGFYKRITDLQNKLAATATK